MRDSAGGRAALAILATHHLAQNFLLVERGYVPGNLAVAGVLLGVGRRSGLRWEEMGLQPRDLPRGLRMGFLGSGVAAWVALLALSHPRTRELLRDERASLPEGGRPWKRVLIRFPLGTALFEEVAFRGVLPALLSKHRHERSADAVSAVLFGLWHLIPAHRALSGNPLGLGRFRSRRWAVTLGGSIAAGVSGLALSWMRRTTGSLLAPWMIHSALNSFSFLAGAAALRSPGDSWRSSSAIAQRDDTPGGITSGGRR